MEAAAVASTPAAPVPAPTSDEPPKEAVCAECGRIFGIQEMIRHQGKYICAGCKPIFFQRLREGGGPSPIGAEGTATEEQVLAREYEIDLGSALSRAWETFTKNAGNIIGAFIVVGLVYLVCLVITGMVAGLLGQAGQVAGLVGALYTAPLLGGLIWFTLKLVRDQPASL